MKKIRLLKFLLLASSITLFAQKHLPHFEIGPHAQVFVGGEINASHDFIYGVNLNYHLGQIGAFAPFAKLSTSTDLGNLNARLISADLLVGNDWKFNKWLGIKTAVGGIFIDENHLFELTDQRIEWKENTLGLTAEVGPTFQISPPFQINLFVKQTNLIATSIGLGVQYSL